MRDSPLAKLTILCVSLTTLAAIVIINLVKALHEGGMSAALSVAGVSLHVFTFVVYALSKILGIDESGNPG